MVTQPESVKVRIATFCVVSHSYARDGYGSTQNEELWREVEERDVEAAIAFCGQIRWNVHSFRFVDRVVGTCRVGGKKLELIAEKCFNESERYDYNKLRSRAAA